MDAALADRLRSASGLAFLCSGNMIRSAFAELYARHLACPLPVRSGATVYRNDAIHAATARALQARGVDPGWTNGFRPTHLSELLPQMDERAVFLGMTREHLHALPPDPSYAARAFLLTAALDRGDEIADPMFHGGLEPALATIAACVEALVRELAGR